MFFRNFVFFSKLWFFQNSSRMIPAAFLTLILETGKTRVSDHCVNKRWKCRWRMRKRPARFLASELIRSREGNCNASRSDSSDAGVCMTNVVERSLAAVNDAIHWLLEVGSVRFCVERYIFYELVNPNARWKCARGNGVCRQCREWIGHGGHTLHGRYQRDGF